MIDTTYGYWRESKDEISDYPWPKEREPWKGQERFLENLEIVEEDTIEKHYKGWSTCRICKKKNGSTEFTVKSIGTWPFGYKHYIKDHNIKPPKRFIRKINTKARRASPKAP